MSDTMTWEQKFHALNALAPASLHMRRPGDWYVIQNVELAKGCMLSSEHGNGASPEEAVDAHRLIITTPKPGQALVLDSMKPTRRHVRWNGFMWTDDLANPPKVTQ